jgi:acetolactate synthase-1/2/3 large subunit
MTWPSGGPPPLALLHLGPGLANGLANLHNARRAGSPIVLIVGDMASWHVSSDPLLNMDIASIASTVSSSVVQLNSGSQTSQGGGGGKPPAFQATVLPRGVQGSRIGTIIMPHDASWGPAEQFPSEYVSDAIYGKIKADSSTHSTKNTWEFAKDCATAIEQEIEEGGKTAIFLGGVVLANAETLEWAGRISAVTGATLICDGAFSRIERGVGMPDLLRLPYFPQVI